MATATATATKRGAILAITYCPELAIWRLVHCPSGRARAITAGDIPAIEEQIPGIAAIFARAKADPATIQGVN